MYQKLYSVKNILKLMFFVFALMNFTISSAALPVPAPPEVAAKNYLLIDFASGICYALDGTMEKVATGVYLLKPRAAQPRYDEYTD